MSRLAADLTLTGKLKAATHSVHLQLHDAPYFRALVGGKLALESYVGQLRALATIHGVLEQALDASAEPALAAVWNGKLRKLPLLQQDLDFFAPRWLADVRAAAAVAQSVADRIRLLSQQQPLALLGYLYVLEGSTLGALALWRMYARAFALQGEDGLRYLRQRGPDAHALWSDFRQRLNALVLDDQQQQQVADGALELFASLAGTFAALHPLQPGPTEFLASTFNPEAGRHPVAQDPRELQAALRAGERCWQRYPYLELRYGERGRRYARSDGAWLATLYTLEPAMITRQLRWLTGVLAARGIPSLVLQAQLELLVEEMAVALPERAPGYQRLLHAAQQLAQVRDAQLTPGHRATLVRAFERAVGPQRSAVCPDAAELLLAALADELGGLPGASQEIYRWMTDRARFPAAWIAALEETLAAAREQAGDVTSFSALDESPAAAD